LVGEEGKIFAIEPSSINFEYLNENIKLANAKNIISYNLAIGEKNGETNFLITEKSNLSKTISDEGILDKKNVIIIPMKRLDSFVDELKLEKIDYLRMYIDGMIQITARNSDGILVVYYQSPIFTIPDHEITKDYIKKFFEKKTIIRDSNKVEVLYYNLPFLITEDTELGLWHITHPQAGLKLAMGKTPIFNFKQGDIIMAGFYIFSLD